MPSRVPRVTKTEAIVLRHRRFGDADRVVTLLTPHRGKIEALAKGALRTKSRLAGHLEPLVHVEVVLAHGRSLDIVTQAQTLEGFRTVRDDLDRLSTAMYLLELVDRFTVEHADASGLYELLRSSLVRLARGDGVQLVSRSFELALLDVTGFRPELEQCVTCTAAVPAEDAHWTATGGGVLCASCAVRHEEAAVIDSRVLRVLRAIQQLPYEQSARIRLDGELAGRLELVMHALMRSVSERELKSAQFVSAARRAALVEELSEPT